MELTVQRSFGSNVSLLKQKASKHSVIGVLIAASAIIIATLLSGYLDTKTIGFEAFVLAQKSNPVLWILDTMPFLFAVWGQNVSSMLSYEAGAMIVDQTHELQRQSIILEQKAAHDATHDSLTGLPNRTLFIDRLQQATVTAKRDNSLLAVLILDLDRFKEINDSLGHYNGDRLLKGLALRLSGIMKETYTLARLGGDEFGIILPSLENPEAVPHFADRIKKSLTTQFTLENLSIEMQVSIGGCIFPDQGTDSDTLIQKADVAMYVAKQNKLGYALYSEEFDTHNPHRLTLMGELRNAIHSDELILHYQPKIWSKNGNIYGVEALVRWNHPTHGLMPPGEFIPLAERTGLIDDLTGWVLKEALRQCAIWHENNTPLTVAVNLSSLCLLNPNFPEILTGLLMSHSLPKDSLILEITETSMMVDPDRAMSILNLIKRQGVKLSIDDFGTGYSSLAYLKELPASELKIDQSFVIDMLKKESNQTIIKATIQLGHNLGLQVVAEGVETRQVSEMLEAMGCDLQQGFLFSKAIPPEDLSDWLKTRYPGV